MLDQTPITISKISGLAGKVIKLGLRIRRARSKAG